MFNSIVIYFKALKTLLKATLKIKANMRKDKILPTPWGDAGVGGGVEIPGILVCAARNAA